MNATEQQYSDRVETWKATVNAELESLLSQASHIRAQITSAKTATKRAYYERKFAKVRAAIMQMLVALQRLNNQQESSEVTTDTNFELVKDEPSPAVTVA